MGTRSEEYIHTGSREEAPNHPYFRVNQLNSQANLIIPDRMPLEGAPEDHVDGLTAAAKRLLEEKIEVGYNTSMYGVGHITIDTSKPRNRFVLERWRTGRINDYASRSLRDIIDCMVKTLPSEFWAGQSPFAA